MKWIRPKTTPKSYKWICSECGQIAYSVPRCRGKEDNYECEYKYCPNCGAKKDNGFTEVVYMDDIREMPTVEADVVRCKDCKYMFTQGKTTKFYFCNEFEISVDETDYCAWGEKNDKSNNN